jgi:hypothetical protein
MWDSRGSGLGKQQSLPRMRCWVFEFEYYWPGGSGEEVGNLEDSEEPEKDSGGIFVPYGVGQALDHQETKKHPIKQCKSPPSYSITAGFTNTNLQRRTYKR